MATALSPEPSAEDTVPLSDIFVSSTPAKVPPHRKLSFLEIATRLARENIPSEVCEDTSNPPSPRRAKASLADRIMEKMLRGRAESNPVIESLVRSRVHLVGESGSGKTTLKARISDRAKGLLQQVVMPSFSSGSSPYYFSSAKGEKMEITFVDGGPLEMMHGPSQSLLCSGSVIIVVVNLSYTKQKRAANTNDRAFSRTSFSAGSVFLHPRQQDVVLSSLRTVASCSPGCSIVFVGTHKDCLLENSKGAVELVLRWYRALFASEISRINERLDDPNCLRLLACFAVDCEDQTCVSENAGGPETIHQMWKMICEMALKDARIDALGETPFGAGVLETKSFRDALRMVQDARNEGILLVSLADFRKSLFINGGTSFEQQRQVTQALVDTGEVIVLDHQPKIPGRTNAVVLFPHLLVRSVSIVVLFNKYVSYPMLERAKILPMLDIAACDNADPGRLLSNGQISSLLLFHLSKSISFFCGSMEYAHVSFTKLLLLADFAFPWEPPESQVGGSPNKQGPESEDEGRKLIFIAPSLRQSVLPSDLLPELLSVTTRHAIIGRRIVFTVPPPGFFTVLLCRLGPMALRPSCVFSDALWFTSPDSPMDVRCLALVRNDVIDFLFFAECVGLKLVCFVDLVIGTLFALLRAKYRGCIAACVPLSADAAPLNVTDEMKQYALSKKICESDWVIPACSPTFASAEGFQEADALFENGLT